jgi:DNA helicase-2/ATP-dependent DNA helicase PcrA
VAAEQFYADRLDDLKSVLARIEWRLDWEERPKGALSEMAPSHGMSARNVFADLAQNQIEPNADIVVGSRVMHHKFGKGTVTEVDGPKVTADFDQVGQKKVMHTFLIPMKDRLSSV